MVNTSGVKYPFFAIKKMKAYTSTEFPKN
ncbi:hypothetical protein NC653_024994 [Populus alba x Populus x berolinensis]|uniref:Uncharacterized protein n=1 Tax=Populus alba x Populus x berolinensis TaxID=444605 RepID=A0AAD6Q7G3_9ROSI|nr:hypothetical protein NC653_024994 [Populus alba x Populus x berolinensis]